MIIRGRQQNGRAIWPVVGIVGGITAVFLGYLSVWIPGPAAGLQFIGVEVGEWLKFLGVGPIRNIFYLPPIMLGSIVILYSFGWRNGRWQSWLWRLLGCGIALLSFPALEDIRGTSQAEYFPRIWLIFGVFVLFGLVTLLSFRQRTARSHRFIYLLIGLIGIVGAAYPTWLYAEIQPTVSLVMGSAVGVGLGVWLNGLGHLSLTLVALKLLYSQR